MNSYPRPVTIENPKLRELLQEKGDLILVGRELSDQIEKCEVEMKAADEAIQAIERAVDKGDIDERAKLITDDMNIVMGRMEALKKELVERLKAAVAPEAIALYEDAKKRKEDLETERNKVGLKVQKFNDRIIPLARKCMKEFLADEYEDYDTLRLEDGEVRGTIFSHMETFKEQFAKKKSK